MKYYIDASGAVYAYELDGSQDFLIGDKTPITEEELAQHLDPTPDELAAQVRADRDNRLVTEVDPIVSNPLRWAALTAAKQAEWTQYRTDLLTVPDQAGFPTNITWPTKPGGYIDND